MKNYLIALLIVVLISISKFLNAQPPPPPPSGGHGSANNNPAGAPVGNGLGFLLVLSVFYGYSRVYRKRLLSKNNAQDTLG